MSSGAFLALCKAQLSSADVPLLEVCTLDPDLNAAAYEGPSSGFIDAWSEWERCLRLNLARYRKERLKWEGAGVEPPDMPADAAAAAKTAVGFDSPLEAELFLGEARWKAIESFQGLDYFGENMVYAYLLKLLLLERKSLFKAEEGFAEYQRIYNEILDTYNVSKGE
jgi:hypothetical protein